MAEQITPEKIMQLGTAFWGSKTLLSAVELGLFSELANGPANAEELARRHGLHQRGAAAQEALLVGEVRGTS